MADVVIENAIKALKQRRNEIDEGIRALERVSGSAVHSAQLAPAGKKRNTRTGKPMSAAAKAKLRAAYAANHPGWKPKKK
jgi:hypothetical protein